MIWVVMALLGGVVTGQPNGLAQTPPMGWMSWEIFRCHVNCTADPNSCVNEQLYRQMSDALVSGGFLEAGYESVSIDDCWEEKQRDAQGRLQGDKQRFPSGMKALGDYMHSKGVKFGIYSDEGTNTCQGYPGSEGHEKTDAATFASWGVDYLKLDGCHNNHAGYATGYPAMGKGLNASGRPIVYSCSWPAYMGSNESTKPFAPMIAAGCNLWRNYRDIQDNWGSLQGIIDHWGQYTQNGVLQKWAGPGHWHDMDMLLAGDPGLTDEEARTQMSIWSICAAPLIMGNDLRNLTASAKAILLNKEVIAVDQDPMGKMGGRKTDLGTTEVWSRDVTGGVAAVLLNKGDSETQITASFATIGVKGPATVRDLWKGKDLGTFHDTFSATVPSHGVAFVKLTPA